MEKSKNTITKWLVVLSRDGYQIIHKEISKFAPINRVLDQVGFYEIDSKTIEGRTYLVVYDPSERELPKTRILITKIHKDQEGERMIDLCEHDISDVMDIIEHYMHKEKTSFLS